jgi:hypothetical protein
MKTSLSSVIRSVVLWGVFGFFILVALQGAAVIALNSGLLPKSVVDAAHELARPSEGCE